MKFTGKNLARVRRGLDLALSEIHNRVATCPDVFEHADALVELESEKEEFEWLLIRVDKAIEKENQK